MQCNKKIFILNCKYLTKPDKIHTALSDCKIKDFIWDSPCNYPKIASLDTPYTDSVKLLIYKEKRRFSASSSWVAEHIVQSTDYLLIFRRTKEPSCSNEFFILSTFYNYRDYHLFLYPRTNLISYISVAYIGKLWYTLIVFSIILGHYVNHSLFS